MISMYVETMFKLVETDTIIKYSRDDFGKCTPLNYKYIDSVLEINGRYYIKQLNQLCLILIMFTEGLGFYQCLNGL